MDSTDQPQVQDRGFHAGELAVQRHAGVEDDAAGLAGMLEGAELTGRLAAFLADRTFLVITARDPSGRLWTSVIVGAPGFLEVRSSTTLVVQGRIAAGDPLDGLAAGQKIGMTAIEFALRRRVRINGILREVAADHLVIEVEQAYGNCPQYIQQRHLVPVDEPPANSGVRTGSSLSADDLDLVRSADTFFLGTINPSRGADASHRGGPPSFVRAEARSLWWPDYPGNNLFNSFGNLEADPEAALLFVDFVGGRTLQLSGTAGLDWGARGRAGDDGGTGRIATFAVERVVARSTLALAETAHAAYARNPMRTG